jgi:hypothetical protein
MALKKLTPSKRRTLPGEIRLGLSALRAQAELLALDLEPPGGERRRSAGKLRALRRKLHRLRALARELKRKSGWEAEARVLESAARRGEHRLARELAATGTTLLLRAEEFAGPWNLVTDRTYFPGFMGKRGFRSSFKNLTSLGVRGGPVAKAALEKTISLPRSGRYHVWGRGLWGEGDRGWRVEIGRRRLPAILGNGPANHCWRWQKAGEIRLDRGKVRVKICDVGAGIEGVDCVLFTTDASHDPQLEEELLEERSLEVAPPSRAPAANEKGRLTAALRKEAASLPEFTPPRSLAAWERRREERKARLRQLLGLEGLPRPEVRPRLVWEDRGAGLLRRRIEFESEPGWQLSCLLCTFAPSSPFAAYETRRKTVICLPARPAGASAVAGLADSPLEDGYGWELARRGYLVICPETRGFGPAGDLWLIGHFLQHNLRRPLLGMQAWDAIRCLDYLERSGLADMDRIGIVGFDFGGAAAMYAAALEERLKVVVQAGYCFSWRREMQADTFLRHAYDLVPGLAGEMDLGEIDALMAPRALLLSESSQAGRDLEGARRMAEQTRQVYDLYRRPERFKAHFHDGPDVFSTEICLNWIDRWMG